MARLNALAALAGLLAALAAGAADAQQVPDPREIYSISQAAIGATVGPHVLTDARGQRLAVEAMRGKPLVVSIVYTSCGTVCPAVSDHLRDSVVAARAALGTDSFDVLTFGFDASGDTPARLTAFARVHRLDLPGWRVASAPPEVTEAFLADLGFSYIAAAGGFEHLSQTTILDAEGRVYRQVYGDSFPLPMLVEPLKELVLGRTDVPFSLGALRDRIDFWCTVYDPATRSYRYSYAIFFGIGAGGVSLLLTGAVIFRLWRANRRYRAAALSAARAGRKHPGEHPA